jgi:Domain of unknown function (DUF929)
VNTPVPPRGNKGRSAKGRPAPGRPAQGRQVAYQRQRRQRQFLFGGIGGVVIIVVALVLVYTLSSGGSGGSDATPPASPSVLAAIEGVSPASMAAQAKADPPTSPPVPISNGASLTEDGKPKIVYIGAEYCPYCGGERWAMIMALSKFGTFTGLKQITSSSTDDPTSIPSFSFVGSTYTSKYIVWDPTETQTVTHATLQTPTKANATLENKYDNPPYTSQGGIPFIDFANKWVIDGASYDVTPLQHLSHDTVAAAASSGSTKYGSDIQSVAGYMVSRICSLTGGKPGNVCSSFPTVLGK